MNMSPVLVYREPKLREGVDADISYREIVGQFTATPEGGLPLVCDIRARVLEPSVEAIEYAHIDAPEFRWETIAWHALEYYQESVRVGNPDHSFWFVQHTTPQGLYYAVTSTVLSPLAYLNPMNLWYISMGYNWDVQTYIFPRMKITSLLDVAELINEPDWRTICYAWRPQLSGSWQINPAFRP